MLQKSIIALSTVFALSACGGSLDLGPDTPPPENGNGENGNGENGNGNGEPGPSQIFTFMNFDNEDSVDTWAYRCIEGCDASAELSWNADQGVLAVMPEWASENDQLEVYSPIDEVSNLEDAGVSAWVFVTEDYIADGNLTMQMFLTNASGATGYLAEEAPSEAGWHRLEAWELSLGDEEDEDAYNSFAWYEEGFNLRNINEVGVLFNANEKSADVGGPLWIDNVLLTRGADAAGPFVVDMDSENWAVLDADGVELQQGGGTVAFSPTGNDQKLAYLLDGPVDMVGGSFTFIFTVDQEFIDSGADVQPLAQQNFGSFGGQFDGCYIGNGELTADEPFEFTCNIDNEALVAEEGENIRVGFQVKGDAAGTVSISYMEIDADGVSSEPAGPFEADMGSEFWAVMDADGVELEQTDDMVSFSPTGNDQKLVYLLDGPADLVGGSFTFTFTVDQAFIESGADVQPLAQQNFGSYDGQFDGCYIGNGELTADEPFEFTCNIDNENIVAEEGENIRVGFQVKGDAAGTVSITSMEIDYEG